MTNTIRHITFDFRMQSETFARTLYAGWDAFCRAAFEKVAAEELERYASPTEVIEIDRLELNLGTLTEDNFYEHYPQRLREAMQKSLEESFHPAENGVHRSQAKHASRKQNEFDLLCYFLLHGTLPWYADTQTDVNRLFLHVIHHSAAPLKRFLQHYGHYTALQQRLVYQLNDPEVEQALRRMRSVESTFICSYMRYMRQKHSPLHRPGVTESHEQQLIRRLAQTKTKTPYIYKQLSNPIRQNGTTAAPDLKQIIMDQSNHWNDLDFIQPVDPAKEPSEVNMFYVDNAGLVIIAPFFVRLFSLLGLLDNGSFISEEATQRAIFILQYAVHGTENKNYIEYELTLNKLLTGTDTNAPLPQTMELADEEKAMVDDMLKGILTHWEKLSRSSVAALRQAFLQRPGAIKVEDDRYQLTVEEKTYDLLLDTLPWSYKTVKYPWMTKRIEVKWR